MTIRYDGRKALACALAATAVFCGCQTTETATFAPTPSAGEEGIHAASRQESAARVVSELRARFAGGQAEVPAEKSVGSEVETPMAPGVANGFVRDNARLRAHFTAIPTALPADVAFPTRATAPFHIEDVRSGLAVDVLLEGAHAAAAETADGYVVYRHAHVSGATMLHRPLPNGTEDFLSFEERPSGPSVAYRVTLQKIGGLRLVANTLEMLDDSGTPRLRVASPYLVGADNQRIEAKLSVDGCAVDTNPAAPWGRAVRAAGSSTCTLRVTWADGDVAYPALLDPKWTTTGSMSVARERHTATVLADGKVLVAGGINGTTTYASAELYDRTTGTWAATGTMTNARQRHATVQLGTSSNTTTSGKVLVAGGMNGTAFLGTAELYSPTTGTWSPAANLNAPRAEHTGTLMGDGRVLFAGGIDGPVVLKTAALYDPSSQNGSWAAVGNMVGKRRSHTATLLATSNATLNGKVLVVGGNSGGTDSVAEVQYFDGTSSWLSAAPLPASREGHTATLLPNGKLLIVGGKNGSTTVATTVVFNPASGIGSWTSAGSMTSARHGHSATLLSTSVVANGQVLVAGGSSGSGVLGTAELFNGVSTWTSTNTMPSPVKDHTASVLGNGVVLIAGGVGVNGSTPRSAADLYDPSLGVSCATGTQCSTGLCANGVCCDTGCTDACGACNLPGLVGTCSPKTNDTGCPDDGNACTADKCNGTSLACQHPAGNAGVTCRAAGHACDVAETCDGTGATCPPDLNAPDGTGCNDGNMCTGQDTCHVGICLAGPPPLLDDGNVCTTDSCNPATGVQHTPVPAGAVCGDDNICNGAEVCNATGVCVPGTPPLIDDGNVCTIDSCNPATGPQHMPVAAGTTCSAGDLCTGVGVCNVAGACLPGAAVTCFASDQCHLPGTCDVGTGICSNPEKPDGPGCAGGVPTRPRIGIPPGPPGTTPIPDYDPGTANCGPGLNLVGLSSDGQGPYHQAIVYVPNPDPTPGPNCHIQTQFCDNNGQPIAAPSEAELNAAPPQSSSCAARGDAAPETCGLNPATITGSCVSEADCGSGEQCGDICEGADCLSMTRACAMPWESCGGVPAESEYCDPNEIRQCSDPRAKGTITAADARAAMPHVTTPQPEGQAPPNGLAQMQPFAAAESGFCNPPPVEPSRETKQFTPNGHEGGNDQWGFDFDWDYGYTSKLSAGTLLGKGKFDVVGRIGGKVVATVFGQEIVPLQASLDAGVANCGFRIGATAKVFGDAVVTADVERDRAGLKPSMGLPPLSPFAGGLETPEPQKSACNQAFDERNNKAETLRKAMWAARDVRKFYLEHGTSIELCERTQHWLNTSPDVVCLTEPNLVTNIDIPNAWIEEYNAKTQEFASFTEPDLILKEKAVGGSIQLNLLPFRNRFDIVGHTWTQPVGPILITISVDLFGQWQLGGAIQAGVLYEGQRPDIFAPPPVPNTPADGDVSVIAGPVVTPGADVDIAVFAGVGIPGVSIGVEGTLVLVRATLSADARANLNRVSMDDPRDLGASYFIGPPIPAMPPRKIYDWHTGYAYGAKLGLDELSGTIDLVARIRLLFFKKTIRYNLAEWDGFHQDLFLIGDSTGAPLKGTADYGKYADRIAHTGVSNLTSTDTPADPTTPATFFGKLGGEQCVIIK